MELTSSEMKLLRQCVKSSLDIRTRFVKTLKGPIEAGGYKEERKTVRQYQRFATIEIPQLTALLNKLKGQKQ